MSEPFPIPDDFDAILTDIWARWGRGSADRRADFHTPIVTSVTAGGVPDPRVMVLRKVDRGAASLRFHTDNRSGKVAQIAANPVVSVIAYDASAKIQVRARGHATLATTGAMVDAAWAATSQSGRRSYMTIRPPGSVSDTPTSGLPDAIAAAAPSLVETEPARAHFSLLIVTLDYLEWLHLAHNGHRRAGFARTGDDWTGQWLIP
jgi:pyridoxamine 5'-phosphate oxidase